MKKILPIFLILYFSLFLQAEAKTPFRVLIVPGHDNEVWGAQYKTRKEADMTLAVATKIFNSLKKDKKFKVYITRDKNGYVKEFADYFSNHEADIISFKENAKKAMQDEIANGAFIEKENVPHVAVSPKVAIHLYGINKWANENKMDAVIHIHFNDYPRATPGTIGKYTGFSIYMPDAQPKNGFKSGQLAANIYSQLVKKYKVSNYEKEIGGMIADQKLIALGASGTLDASVRSVLIEYGYIYEKKFRQQKTREQAYKNMAIATVTGIKNYFLKR